MQPARHAQRPPRRRSSRSLLCGGAAIAIAAVAVAVQLPVGVGAAATSAKLVAPVIHETFTSLPCPDAKNPATTLEMQGCTQIEILATDKKIDAVAKAIFARWRDDAARRRFVRAQRSWFTFRNADCVSVSDKFEGGSLAGPTVLNCDAERGTQHLKEIRAFLRLLQREG